MNAIAGHDTIEFGWNICTWIPFLRYKKRYYDEFVIVCNPENRYLYEDFADKFIDYYDRHAKPDMYFSGRFPTKLAQVPYEILDKPEYFNWQYIHPCKKCCEKSTKVFFKYGQIPTDIRFDIAIHARAETKYGQGKLNYSEKNYECVVEQFKGLKICSVGAPGKSHHIKGTEDLRGVYLKYLCHLLANTKVVVGTSSGPMHLASFCGAPHIVLTGDSRLKSLNKLKNRDRYQTLWNPFNTPVTVLDEDNWHPHPKKIIKAIKEYL
jgi:hypothetical protein